MKTLEGLTLRHMSFCFFAGQVHQGFAVVNEALRFAIHFMCLFSEILSYLVLSLYADESIARNSPTIHSEKKIHNVEVTR